MKPEKTLDYVDFLLRHDMLEDALKIYVSILEDDETNFSKSKFELWMEMCEFLAKHPRRA